jgi:hypothetical protein
MDGKMDRQTGKEIHRQIERYIDIQRDRQTDEHVMQIFIIFKASLVKDKA